jgi:hypothetical protein
MTKIYENIIRSDIDKRIVHIDTDFSNVYSLDNIIDFIKLIIKEAKEISTPDDMYVYVDFLENYDTTKVFGVHNQPLKTSVFVASLENAIRYFIRHVHFHYYIPMYSLIVIIKNISQHDAGDDEIQTRFIYSTSTIEKVILGDTDGS